MNHLEQLVAEWYEYQGYFVRKNVNVGLRARGGYECELDVVAFSPATKHLVHVEASLDAESWERREHRFAKKFDAGRRYIPELFKGLGIPAEIEQVALLAFASTRNRDTLAGARILLTSELFAQIVEGIQGLKMESSAIPQQFALLRTIQFACQHRHAAGWT